MQVMARRNQDQVDLGIVDGKQQTGTYVDPDKTEAVRTTLFSAVPFISYNFKF